MLSETLKCREKEPIGNGTYTTQIGEMYRVDRKGEVKTRTDENTSTPTQHIVQKTRKMAKNGRKMAEKWKKI